jgi:hypothetical protein
MGLGLSGELWLRLTLSNWKVALVTRTAALGFVASPFQAVLPNLIALSLLWQNGLATALHISTH